MGRWRSSSAGAGYAVSLEALTGGEIPDDWDSGLKLALGVLGGVAIALPALAMGPRIPSLAGGSSSEHADALNDVVVSWLDALAPPKLEKRRKKKRPPPG